MECKHNKAEDNMKSKNMDELAKNLGEQIIEALDE